MEKCGRCAGEGRQVWDEDGRRESDVCYRCGGTGKVDEESARELRLEVVAHALATRSVEAKRNACNEDPDGESWSFCAAENMMSERDYTTAMIMDHAARHIDEIAKLSSQLQDALMDALAPRAAEQQTVRALAPAAPVSEDEIPF